ncbi:hypothetical protein [Rhizobium calliandrae]|uniref:hypothetical protein n=1 Tax=Rhizobium calliandrae TaxID=1312182 RepID=UPI0032E49492
MPLAALETTPVDLSAPADSLADAIIHFAEQPPGPAMAVPIDIRIEVAIAAGRKTDPALVKQIGELSPLTCLEYGGVLSEVRQRHPLRFRCQVGHGYTSATLMAQQQGDVDDAMRVALRIINERAGLVGRITKNAADARGTSRGI